jgi:hypothetical protein
MKRDIAIGTLVILMVTFCWIMTPSPAMAEQLMTAKIESTTVAKDKNGNEYIRFIVAEQKEVGGVKYAKTIPVLAFRENVGQAKAMRAGDTLKAVVSHNALPDGRESYRIMAFADAGAAKKK